MPYNFCSKLDITLDKRSSVLFFSEVSTLVSMEFSAQATYHFLYPFILLFNCFIMFTYLREREREREAERGRERKTQNLKQAPSSELSEQNLGWGLNSQTMRSWPEMKPDAQPTEAPRLCLLFNFWYTNLPSDLHYTTKLRDVDFFFVNHFTYF